MPMPQTVNMLTRYHGEVLALLILFEKSNFGRVSGEGSLYLQIVPVFQTAPLTKVLRERLIISRKEL